MLKWLFGKWEIHAVNKDKMEYGFDVYNLYLYENSKTKKRKFAFSTSRLSNQLETKYTQQVHVAALWMNHVDDNPDFEKYFTYTALGHIANAKRNRTVTTTLLEFYK